MKKKLILALLVLCAMLSSCAGAETELYAASVGKADAILLKVNGAACLIDAGYLRSRGKILYADGKYPTLDIAGALKELHDYAIPRVFSDEPEAQA